MPVALQKGEAAAGAPKLPVDDTLENEKSEEDEPVAPMLTGVPKA